MLRHTTAKAISTNGNKSLFIISKFISMTCDISNVGISSMRRKGALPRNVKGFFPLHAKFCISHRPEIRLFSSKKI